MSRSRPRSGQPRAASASIGPLASCSTFGWCGSPIHETSAASSSGVMPSTRHRRGSALAGREGDGEHVAGARAPAPSTCTPTRWPLLALAASQSPTWPGSSCVMSRAKPESSISSSDSSVSNSRSRSTRNSRPSKSVCTSLRSHGCIARSAGTSGRSRSQTSALSRRLRITSSRCSRRLSPALPLISSAWSTTLSRPSYRVIHFAAVFGPTPGTPGGCPSSPPPARPARGSGPGQAVALLDRRRGHPLHLRDAAHRVDDRGAVADELEGVAVARADQHLEVVGHRLGGQGADDVVGLEADLLDERHPEGVEHLLDQGDLALELVGRLGAVGLVVGVLLGAEGRPGDVERHREVGRLLVAQDVDQHRREAVDRVGVLPGRGGEVLHRQRVEGAVGQGVTVQQEQPGTCAGRGRGGGDSSRDGR